LLKNEMRKLFKTAQELSRAPAVRQAAHLQAASVNVPDWNGFLIVVVRGDRINRTAGRRRYLRLRPALTINPNCRS
jgi:hypothetical protein